ncbi:hypothetical protein KFL_004190020 [Klebsormidium nitens]|uniref:RCC1-like domain-containing protein n=1 Tax=Klebsormidium nitens TaxID=105231 RepID=A0A1Y1IGZ5_KLENI|nr:hypothetical protein KFL_004190020 [Klebsormidium nitens]|eukprot:GAQ88331.1 hypothetical protein KFL_004190020 [Klebsormidium nitens]
MAAIVALERLSEIAVESQAVVLSFGDGAFGALGLQGDGILDDAYSPTPVNGLPPDTISVAAGHYHSFAITKGGRLWAWGRDKEGQLGRGVRSDANTEELVSATGDANSLKFSRGHRDSAAPVSSSLPHPVSGLEGVHVASAAGSGVASFAVGNDGSLWAWGSSRRGQLGLGSDTLDSPTPQRVTALEKETVVEVACGWGHAVARTADGAVFAWGYGANCRLGFDVETPKPQTPAPVTQTLSVDEAVEAEIMGERHMPIQWEPRRVEALADVRAVQVACGMDHTLVLSDHGCLYTYGDNTNGQLGRDSQLNGRRSALVRGALQPLFVCHVAAGLSHSLAIARPRGDHLQGEESLGPSQLYSWGWNASGQLGRDAEDDVSAGSPGEVLLPDDDVIPVMAAAGRAHSVAVGDVTEGFRECYGWGSGRNGRHGLEHTSDVSEPEPLDLGRDLVVKQVACGFDHTLLLVEGPKQSEEEG